MADLGLLMVTASVQVLLCGLVLLAARGLLKNRLAARWRVVAWMVLAVRLLVPVSLTITQPAVQLPVPVVTAGSQNAGLPSAGVEQGVLPDTAADTAQDVGESSGDTKAVSPGLTPWQAAVCIWLAGVLAMAGWQGVVRLRFWRRQRDKQLCSDPQLQKMFAYIVQALHLRRAPKLYYSSFVAGPVLVGVLRPKILLPQAFEPQTAQTLELTLWHELCHLKRGDLWAKGLFNLVTVLYWPNPFVHLLRRLAGQDIEHACDERVLRMVGPQGRDAYAGAILANVRRQGLLPVSASAFSSSGRLVRRRLQAVFSKPARRVSAVLVPITLALVLLAGCAVGPAVSQAPSAQPDDGTQSLAGLQQREQEPAPLGYDPDALAECPITGMWMTPAGVRLVASAEDLYRVGLASDSLSLHYLQVADIRVPDDWPVEIGEDGDNPFTGNYDGNGFAIIGLSLAGGESLFPYVQDAVVQNVTLRNPNLPEQRDEQSAIVGSASNCVVVGNSIEYSQFDGDVDVKLLGLPIQFYTDGDMHPYISYEYRNDSEQTMYGGVLYAVAFDRAGQPLNIAWYDVFGNTDRAYMNQMEHNLYSQPLQQGQAFNMDGGWSLTDGWHGGEETDVAYVIATFASIEFESGVWQNPDIEEWQEKWVGRPATVEALEGYYPLALAE